MIFGIYGSQTSHSPYVNFISENNQYFIDPEQNVYFVRTNEITNTFIPMPISEILKNEKIHPESKLGMLKLSIWENIDL